MRFFSKKAQGTLEYAFLIVAVVAGLIAMQSYMQRAAQGKLKESTDDLGAQFQPGLVTYDLTNYSRGRRQDQTNLTANANNESRLPIVHSNVLAGAGEIANGEISRSWGSDNVQANATGYNQSRE